MVPLTKALIMAGGAEQCPLSCRSERSRRPMISVKVGAMGSVPVLVRESLRMVLEGVMVVQACLLACCQQPLVHLHAIP